jgi:hypothetical protein
LFILMASLVDWVTSTSFPAFRGARAGVTAGQQSIFARKIRAGPDRRAIWSVERSIERSRTGMAGQSFERDIDLADTVHVEGVKDVGREAAGRLRSMR